MNGHPVQQARRAAVERAAARAMTPDEAERWYATGETPRVIFHRRSLDTLDAASRAEIEPLLDAVDLPALWLRRPLAWDGRAPRSRDAQVLLARGTPLQPLPPTRGAKKGEPELREPWLAFTPGRTRPALRVLLATAHRHRHVWEVRRDLFHRDLRPRLEHVPTHFDDAMRAGHVGDAFAACGVDVHPDLLALAAGDVGEALTGHLGSRHVSHRARMSFRAGPVWQAAAAWMLARAAPWRLFDALERAERVDPERVRRRGRARRLMTLPAQHRAAASVLAFTHGGRVRIRIGPNDREEFLPEILWTRDLEDEMKRLGIAPGGYLARPTPMRPKRLHVVPARAKKVLRLIDADESAQALDLARASEDPELLDALVGDAELLRFPSVGAMIVSPRHRPGRGTPWVLVELLAMAPGERARTLRSQVRHLHVHGLDDGPLRLEVLHAYPVLDSLTLLGVRWSAAADSAPLPTLRSLTCPGLPDALLTVKVPGLESLTVMTGQGGLATLGPLPRLRHLDLRQASAAPWGPARPSLRSFVVGKLPSAEGLSTWAPGLERLTVLSRPYPFRLDVVPPLRVLDLGPARFGDDGRYLRAQDRLVAYRGAAPASEVVASPSCTSLRAVALRGAMDADLGKLTHVEHLDVAGSDLTHVDFLADLPALHTLVLDSCRSLIDLRGLERAPALRRVSLRLSGPRERFERLGDFDLRGWLRLREDEVREWTWTHRPEAFPVPAP